MAAFTKHPHGCFGHTAGVVVNPEPKCVMVCRKYLQYLMGSVL